MATLEELKAAAERAVAAYAQAKAEARASKLEEVRTLIDEFGFTQAELFKSKVPSAPKVSKPPRLPKAERPPKIPSGAIYEKDGQKWAGIGRPPAWVSAAREAGTLEEYRADLNPSPQVGLAKG